MGIQRGYIAVNLICYEKGRIRCDYRCVIARNRYMVGFSISGLKGPTVLRRGIGGSYSE
jgi:hypothetical protein